MLLTLDYIKQNFPQWDHYAAYDENAASLEDAVSNQLQNAEDELAEYVTVDEQTITDSLKLQLFYIVRYNLFELQHADTEFDRDPAIVTDYQRAISQLKALRDGKRPASPPSPGDAQGKIELTAARRRFDRWFTDTGTYPPCKSTKQNNS